MWHKFGPLTRFIFRILFFSIFWFVIYFSIIKPTGQPDKFLRNTEAKLSIISLQIFGYNLTAEENSSKSTVLYNSENRIIGIANSCNGLLLFIVFSAFVACIPGKIRPKLWFIPFGIIVIYVVNIIRIISLTLIQMHYPSWLNFNHHYVFTIIVYGVIFLLWRYYINKIDGSLKSLSKQ